MKRPRLLLSPVSFGLLLFLFTGLGWTLWRSGGMAFNPGPVSAKTLPGVQWGGFDSHADFEQECWRCHQPLKTNQAPLCLDCHTRTAEEIAKSEGLHGSLEEHQSCFTCHIEHKGRDFDPGLFALTHFDHSKTQFDLVWHQVNYDATPMDCFNCHISGQGSFDLRVESCQECHNGHDPSFMQVHEAEFGLACLDCHDGVDRLVGFDHHTTDFQLDGQHALARCAACHGLQGQKRINWSPGDDPFVDIPRECVGCHREPQIHLGLFGEACQDCHTTQAWLPALLEGSEFNHAREAAFSLARHALDYQGGSLACTACHQGGVEQPVIPQCVNCHAAQEAGFVAEHQELFGSACLDCHDGVDRLSDFDHQQIFPLAGAHAEIACSDCHQDKAFRGTPAQCGSCHAEPDIHAGYFGAQCQYCHTDQAWLPALLHVHSFPLDHGEGVEIACTVCHTETYAQYTCYGCHEHQPDEVLESHREEGIAEADLPACAACHPTGSEHEGEELGP